MKLQCDSCIKIPCIYENESWYQDIVKKLTRSSPSYNNPDIIETIEFFDKRNDVLLIPKYFNIERYGLEKEIIDHKSEDISFNFKSEWRNSLQKDAYEYMISHENGVIQLPPGEGKTVITIGAISKLKKKAIIFVHKDSLADQWKERFLQHTDLDNDSVALLENKKYEEVFQRPIVIATVQSLLSLIKKHNNIEEILKNAGFGISIWDEVHTSGGASQFSKSALYTSRNISFGLSATPERSDQNHDVIHMHMGNVYKPEGKTNTLAPKIVAVYFNHNVIPLHRKYIYWGIPKKDGTYELRYPKFNKPRYLQMLTSKKNEKYISYLRKICLQVYQAERNTLVIADRIKILDLLSMIIPNKDDVGFFIPRSKDERDNDLQKKFVFSTPGSARDGTDKEKFDCLIMATPIGNVEQAIGRVCRFMEGKRQPIVFDLIDETCEELVKSYSYRHQFYKSKGWTIEEKHLK